LHLIEGTPHGFMQMSALWSNAETAGQRGSFRCGSLKPSDMIVAADAFFIQQGRQIADLARKHRMPSVFSFREQVDAGGLMSYGQHLADNFRRAATYVDKIFKGAKPADLPVEQSTKLELVINLRTARALGLTIPPELLVLATEVIE
jgi:putative tryptophan/tyrosine transport system substrate-binding protein